MVSAGHLLFPSGITKENAEHSVVVPTGPDGSRFKKVTREIEHIILPISGAVPFALLRYLVGNQVDKQHRLTRLQRQVQFQFQAAIAIQAVCMVAGLPAGNKMYDPGRCCCVRTESRCTDPRCSAYRALSFGGAGFPMNGFFR